MRPALAALAAAALAHAGCGTSCQEACDNLISVCAEDYRAAAPLADLEEIRVECVDRCGRTEQQGSCPDLDAISACVAEAASCPETRKCPQQCAASGS